MNRSHDAQDDTEHAIDELLEGKPRANELAEMITALESRRAIFQRERESAVGEGKRREWELRLREVDKQIGVLREEQAITTFVENSVRVVANRPRLDMDEDYS